MKRRAFAALLLFSSALLALLVLAGGVPAVGGEDKDDKEKAKIEKQLKAVARQFGDKDSSGLSKRVPEGEKVTLTLSGKTGDYASAEARQVLSDYFGKFQTLSATFKKADGRVGRFDLVVRRKGKDKQNEHTLMITIGRASDDYPLKKISVE